MEYVHDLDMLNKHVDNLAQFVESFESLYQRYIGQRDISLEGFKQYQTELTKLAYRHSFDITGTLDESSLESIYTLSFEADDQKKNIFRRAWDAFVAILKRIYDTLTGKKQQREKLEKSLEKMRAEITASLVKTTPDKSETDFSSPKKYKIEVPRALQSNWGYGPVAKSTSDASGLYLSIFELISKLKGFKSKSQVEQALKQAKVMVDKMNTLASDPKLNAMATDMVEMSVSADKVREIIKYSEEVSKAHLYLYTYTKLAEDGFKGIIHSLEKTPPSLLDVDITTEIKGLGILIAEAQVSMTKIINRESTCYTVVQKTVSRLCKVLTEQ